MYLTSSDLLWNKGDNTFIKVNIQIHPLQKLEDLNYELHICIVVVWERRGEEEERREKKREKRRREKKREERHTREEKREGIHTFSKSRKEVSVKISRSCGYRNSV